MRRIFLRYMSVAGVFSMVLPFILLLSLVVVGPDSKAQAEAQNQNQAQTQDQAQTQAQGAVQDLQNAGSQADENFNYEEETAIVAYNQHNLIRFHVIANSDSDRDQAMKRKIRDLVVEKMTPEFKMADNLADARQIAESHLKDIRKIAQDEVSLWHESYPVKVELGNFDFPVKTYGELTLPAGNYEAVRVVIGQGQGANWWCVLFPPLCFGDVSKGMVPLTVPAAKTEKTAQVKQAKPKSQKAQVKVRFKILETFGFYDTGK